MAKKKSTSEIFLIIMICVAVLGQFFIQKNFKESMANLLPGKYPISVDEPILVNDYPLKKNMGVSNNSSESNFSFFPVFASSLKQYNNNVRYWATPENGLCSRAEMCGGLYKNKIPDIPSPLPIIPFSNKKTRVNFYNSEN
jgi:hypothetical protein